jgi:asparagine synthase (glutamine-hydrolysing)
MCGIIGHVAASGTRADVDAVRRVVEELRHRGPDGGGVEELGQACLGHRRLSIIDVDHSPQPWVSDDGRHVLVYNGEIYNYLELRDELRRDGHEFRSEGDTEVLLEMFRREGEDCLARLNGMFAFAIWDRQERRLFAARDRLGKKPFYYGVSEGGMAFGSELGPLRHFRFLDSGIDSDAVHDFFAYQFIDGARSIYRGVRKLEPAHLLWFHDGQLTCRRYWSPPLDALPDADAAEREEAFHELFTDAVRIRLRSDVPLGAFLSGGLDSAAVVATMATLGSTVKTFTVGFEDSETHDERREARRLSEFFGTQHHEQSTALDPASTLQHCLHHLGEPMADPSCVPTWHLCRHARESVTVALSGDGADELFAGYQRYRARGVVSAYLRLPGWLRQRVIEPVLDGLADSDQYYAASRVKQAKLILAMAHRLERAPNDLSPQVFDPLERSRLLDPELVTIRSRDDVERLGLQGMDPVAQMQMTDLHAYLAEDILSKVDRMSMAHGLEVRSPFLDYRLVEFATRLETRSKLRQGTGKRLIRKAFAPHLPDDVLSRRKHGYHVLGADTPAYFQADEIHRLWREHQRARVDHGFKLWALLCFFVWYRSPQRQEWEAGPRMQSSEGVS